MGNSQRKLSKSEVVRDPSCNRCKLHLTSEHICLLGDELSQKDILIVGEAPGVQEEKEGRLFIGRAGRLLRETLEDCDFSEGDYSIINSVSCRPPDNRTPKPKEIRACRYYVEKVTDEVEPLFVLLLGNSALQSVLDLKGIKKHRGKPIEQDGVVYLPTFAPHEVLRDPSKDGKFEADLSLFAEIVDNNGIPKEAGLNPVVVSDRDLLQEMYQDLKGGVSFDIETTCLYPWDKIAKVNTVGFGTRTTQWILPVRPFCPEADIWTEKQVERILKKLTGILADSIVIAHNGKFDALWMKVHYGVDWEIDFDTMLAHFMLDENSPHSLKYLAKTFFGAIDYDLDPTKAPWEKLVEYHAKDCFYTRKLKYLFSKRLHKEGNVKEVFNQIIMPCADLFMQAELNGFYVNVPEMGKVEKELILEVARLNKELLQYGDINYNSTQQLAELLFKKLKFKPLETTGKGAPSTKESVLKRLDHPITKAILDLRSATKLLGTYINGWKPYLVGRIIHPSFKLHGAVTGRTSCIREGSKVQIPGGTQPIEDIKVGDWVYTYDNDLKLTLRKVTNRWYMGRKKILRVNWVGTGGKTSGYLDCTPDHRLRTTSGEYVRADKLKVGEYLRWRGRYRNGEHLVALHRHSKHRNHLYAVGVKDKLRESVVVFNSIHGYVPEHVHHRDGDPLNDFPDNLEGMTKSQHHSHHMSAIMTSEEAKRRRSVASNESNNHMVTTVELLDSIYPVYDLEVEDTNNFIAEELCVHNCEHPNLQNVPRESSIRSLISAPRGWEFVEADLSQIELRIAAELSGERNMLQTFYNGDDIHWMTAVREIARAGGEADLVLKTAKRYLKQRVDYGQAIQAIMGMGVKEASKIDKEWSNHRYKAKAINFGFLYGMWFKKFRIYAEDEYGIILTEAQARASREAYFDMYPDLEEWHDRQRRYARRWGYVTTLSGRKRRLPQAQIPRDCPERREAERQAINTPVQSFGNELNLMAALQIREEFKTDTSDRIRIAGTVHDSIHFWIRRKFVSTIVPRILEIMTHPALLDTMNIRLKVPIEAEAKIGPWSTGKELDEWLISSR